jgi:hypothetical protein
MIKVVEEIAEQILEQNPGSVVRYRLLRDVPQKVPDCPELQQAKAEFG